MSRPIGTADELECRRKQAVQAVVQGEHAAPSAASWPPRSPARWVRAASLYSTTPLYLLLQKSHSPKPRYTANNTGGTSHPEATMAKKKQADNQTAAET